MAAHKNECPLAGGQIEQTITEPKANFTTSHGVEPLKLTVTKTEARVDSREISRQMNVKSRASIALIERYADKFKSLGLLTFKKAVMQRKGQPERYALLTEDQAIFLLTLSRNTDIVVVLKARLTKAFGEARKSRELHQTEYLPAYHALHDRIKVLANGSPNERFIHMNANRLMNKVSSIEAGQRAGANLPTQSLLIVAQMMAAQAMQSAPDHREGYQRAKAAMKPLLALTMGKTLQIGGA
jgi:phage regulator Rha-like protein